MRSVEKTLSARMGEFEIQWGSSAPSELVIWNNDRAVRVVVNRSVISFDPGLVPWQRVPWQRQLIAFLHSSNVDFVPSNEIRKDLEALLGQISDKRFGKIKTWLCSLNIGVEHKHTRQCNGCQIVDRKRLNDFVAHELEEKKNKAAIAATSESVSVTGTDGPGGQEGGG